MEAGTVVAQTAGQALAETGRSLTLVDVVLLVFGGLGVLGGTRWVFGRRARAAAAGGVAAPGAGRSEDGNGASLPEDAVAFTLPASLPVSRGIREVTHNELHAIELGVAAGIMAKWLLSRGHGKVAVGLVVAFGAGAFGLRRYGSKAIATIRAEPWYAMISLGIGGVVGYLMFYVGPAMGLV